MSLRRWLGALAAPSQQAPRSHIAPAAPGEGYEADFVEFLKTTRDLDDGSARQLIARSQGRFAGGWAGSEYRDFTELALEVLRPLHDDTSPSMLFDTYRVHAPFDFLRMLSYRVPSELELRDLADALGGRPSPVIVDYGCGLAQRTIALARALRQRGTGVHLTLVDIYRRPHVEFLSFLCGRHGIDHDYIEVSVDRPYPGLPPHDYCDAVNVLEHLADPVRVVDNIHASMRDGGLLVASVDDQEAEMMHVSPNLGAVRARLAALGFTSRRRWLDATVFEKTRNER